MHASGLEKTSCQSRARVGLEIGGGNVLALDMDRELNLLLCKRVRLG